MKCPNFKIIKAERRAVCSVRNVETDCRGNKADCKVSTAMLYESLVDSDAARSLEAGLTGCPEVA